MEKISPSHKEIMDYLDCCWFTSYHKGICECKSKCQFKDCYAEAKKRLTKTVYTEEEIKQKQEQNKKSMNDIERALRLFHGDN